MQLLSNAIIDANGEDDDKDYRYTYVMNNPLIFTDPSGYRPDLIFEEEEMMRRSGGGTGFNYFGWIYTPEKPYWAKITNDEDWTFVAGPDGRNHYVHKSHVYVSYDTDDIEYALEAMKYTVNSNIRYYLKEHGTVIGDPDALGSKHVLLENSNFATVLKVPYWVFTGSYYNHLYYFSGLAAYSPNEAFRFAQKYRNGGTPFTRGGSVSLTAMFAFGGGWQFELGVVWDHHGGRKAYFNTGPTVGYDLSAGIQIREIIGYNRFDADMYGGFNTSIDGGIGPIDLTLIGGDNEFDRYQSEFRTLYEEYGWGVSLGSPLGFSWQMGHTTIF